MPKIALFLKKVGKIAVALGVEPPNPCWLSAAGGFASRSPNCYSHSL